MNHRQTRSTGDGALLRRYEYDDGWIVAADLGVDDADVSVDTVGGTAIVVVEGPDGPVESEFELPGTAADAVVNNGVLTVEGER
ncbi:Hsp20/alpha crystallin family protein [Halorubrum sp. GN11_10-6_MGM]|uniref:Hsp20/alpha crystallin family protein n=1 Tax=Halorubrum sp. GN11_10-6_MGM TaxID=2518112 RepID=UPI0010F9AF98|nr:Hsp20/alpha crystallin family protein [Halorubrum sp. GN11_10-6_MGM]TKX75338.1 Hsp20/alpha crystallin family protein [Halorubrum sp. GN11_10-6_MGM]